MPRCLGARLLQEQIPAKSGLTDYRGERSDRNFTPVRRNNRTASGDIPKLLMTPLLRNQGKSVSRRDARHLLRT